jgi:hypothetical protein
LPNGNCFERRAECIVPNAFVIPDIRETGRTPKGKTQGSELSWAVPIDNEHGTGLSIVAWPREEARRRVLHLQQQRLDDFGTGREGIGTDEDF